MYDTLALEYKEFLAQKIALGENELEAQKLDLQAEPKSRLVLSPGDSTIDSPFTKPAYLVEVQAKTGAKPNTTEQVINAVRQELGFEPVSLPQDYALSQVRETGQQVAQDTVRELHAATEQYMQAVKARKEAEVAASSGKIDKYQQKLDAATENYTGLQQQQEAAAKVDNTELLEKLTAQIAQQQPKINQLKTQLGKAKLDLNGKEFRLAKEQRSLKGTLEEVSALIEQFPVGQPVRLMDKDTKNYLYGVVAGVEQKNRANNPAAPGNWKLKLLVVDGVRSLSVRLDSLVKGGKQALERVEAASSFLDIKQESSIYELFDQRQTEAKEKRYLVSGQVLASQLTGKFAQVTDNQGKIHPVYLLRRGFDPAVDMDLKPVMLKDASQIKQFLFDNTERLGIAQTPDENLSVIADISRANAGGIILKTAKATAEGGIYFKDEGLRELVGDFTSKTESVREGNTTKSQSLMIASVRVDKTDEVLNYLCNKWGLGAASHKDVARVMTKQVLPNWEPCSEINPDATRLPVTRAAGRVVVGDLPRTLATASIPQIDSSPGFVEASIVGEESLSNSSSNAISNRKESVRSDHRMTTAQAIANASTTFAAPTPAAIAPPKLEPVELIKQVLEANQLEGAAEKNVAKLLHQSGLAAEILKSEDFHLKVENEPYTPLSIERQGKELYLTHFLADTYGELFIDSEMVFNVSTSGQLTLTQTATHNPFTGGESRSLDREFGKLFSKNLLDQGFAAAALITYQTQAQSQLKSTTSVVDDRASQPLQSMPSLTDDRTSQPATSTPPTASDRTSQKLVSILPVVSSSKQQPAASQPPTLSNYTKLASSSPSTTNTKTNSKSSSSSKSASASPTTVTSSQPKEKERVDTHQQLSLFDTEPKPSASVKQLSTTSRSKEKPLETTSTNTKCFPQPQSISSPDVDRANDQRQEAITKQKQVTDTEAQSTCFEPMQVFQQLVDRVDRRTGDFLTNLQTTSPSLDTLRQWYKAARELGKSQKYLERITEVAGVFKQKQVLPEKASAAMQQDLHANHERSQIIAELNRLGNRDFLLLQQSISDYLNTAPTLPPNQAIVQSTQAQITQIVSQRENLFKEYSRLNNTINNAGNGLLRSFNREYKQAIAAAEKILNQISTVLTQQEQKERQIIHWGKLAQAYQVWENDPKTQEVQKIAQVLELPQMREKLIGIQATEQLEQSHLERLSYTQQAQEQSLQQRGQSL